MKFPPLPAHPPEERRLQRTINRPKQIGCSRFRPVNPDLRYRNPAPMLEDLPSRFHPLLQGVDPLALSIVKTMPSINKPRIIPIENDLDSCMVKFEHEEVMMRGKLEPVHALQFQPLPNELLNILFPLTDKKTPDLTRPLNRSCEGSIPVSSLPLQGFQMKKILVWNYRGAKRRAFHETVDFMKYLYRPNIFIFLDTMLSCEEAEDLTVRIRFSHYYAIAPEGFSGGIWMIWNETNCDVQCLLLSERSIHAIIKMNPNVNLRPWLLSVVYAPLLLQGDNYFGTNSL
ncbi:hypothetical protein FRX31_030374 [Thalictrum thalictroides]|uniref:Uncharacterized protein n=1 Tax=Thalictrum thalictroides TaxID=46969 RepID=A0A7J6V4P8_THATH|nr:hypothetical protein FRX31_030374 [Thalictrum thalictroides]